MNDASRSENRPVCGQLEAASGELVFSGSLTEADAFIAARREASELSWLEGGLMGIGALLMASAFLPVYSREEPKGEPVEREPVLEPGKQEKAPESLTGGKPGSSASVSTFNRPGSTSH